MWSHGSFYWNELMTRNVEQAKRFYSSSIGWTFEPMPMPDGTYWVATMGDKPVPDVGRIAILTEPGGAGIGWITPVGDE